ncbi:flagellar basal body P-ring protein FlgI [Thermodesulfatator autotrophicus]|uniref:Flagellar P-ring protein n=1 Tax=Thermodesulfatator autotrophicus TaxID=1795632 RepID=A0A177E9W1_9BACT|nr:flagellar basal body P-ring protein FlgI [Thermodesulfatator autotrophicus]OAG28588.1 flagellar biosynthesis protein FlgA [Thermodesulfatator autotrophicus]
MVRRVLILLLAILLNSGSIHAARLKDLVNIEGVRSNSLIGYGVVVGLQGTGDGDQSKFAVQSVVNMLERFGVHVDRNQVKLKNVAAVMVTAELPPFVRAGQRIDVTVSSIGDAKSLQGGTLLITPLRGPDGQVYALAQGPISLGGFAAAGAGATAQKNHPTVGKIPGGAIVEREVPVSINGKGVLRLSFRETDFTTVARAAEAINAYLNGPYAKPLDGRTLTVLVPAKYRGKVVSLLAEIGDLSVEPDVPARVVIDERTGTVVMGENVRISRVAIAHGNLSVQIKETPQVIQPPFSAGETVVVPETEIKVEEEKARLVVLEEGVSIGELVRALNAVGATPRDLIAIFQAIKRAGALQAELVIM